MLECRAEKNRLESSHEQKRNNRSNGSSSRMKFIGRIIDKLRRDKFIDREID